MDLAKEEVLTPIWLLRKDRSDANNALWAWSRAGMTARGVRGSKMRTTAGMMDEFSAAWQFPYYFGENWAAFDECLAEMDWLLPVSRIVVMIYEADQTLADDSPDQLKILVETIGTAIDEYSRESGVKTDWYRPAVPMHVVLQSTEEAVTVKRWTEAGAVLRPFEEMDDLAFGGTA
jgi:hypothetical protein